MATYATADPNSPGGQDESAMAAQYGLTLDQYQKIKAQYQPVYVANSQGGQYGMSSGGSYQQNPELTNVLNTLQAQKQFGLGQQQNQGPPASAAGQVSNDPMNAATNLGAAALNMPAVYNPTPSQVPKGSKGGVAQVASPVSSGSVPGVQSGPWTTTASVFTPQSSLPPSTYGQADWNTVAQGAGLSQSDIAEFQKQGMTPAQAAAKFNVSIPGQGTQGGTPTARPIPNPVGSQPATPYATAPAAPGGAAGQAAQTNWANIQGQPPPAPNQFDPHALEQAGKALYAHYGGDPNTATHEDILNFHNQLQGHIQDLFGGAPPAAQNYTAGIPPGISAAGGPPAAPGPKPMAQGGYVPGHGNQDTVPALLTPGEYVIPKAQAQQMNLPLHMADGGYVPDVKDRDRPLPRLMTASAPASGTGSTAGSGSDAPQQQQQSNAPAAPSDYQGMSGMDWARVAQQAQAAQAANANVGSGGPGSIDSLGTLGDESIITGQGGPGQPGGAGSATMAASGAISDLANGLTKAAQTYAASVKPWQMQQDATEKFRNNVIGSQPAATFRQEGS